MTAEQFSRSRRQIRAPALVVFTVILGVLTVNSFAFEAPALPRIPDRTFDVGSYGGSGDGKTLNTGAIQEAIDAASNAGGGTVLLDPGTYVSGPINLKSNIDLRLEKGATLMMSSNIADYPVAGTNRESFITATDQHDIQISGEGAIDGQGAPWWAAFRAVKGTPQAGPRRPQMILLTRCERVRLQGFTTRNPPNTHCSMSVCTDVTVDGLTMSAPGNSPNTDGLNLSGNNFLIIGCDISTGDDNIVFVGSGSGGEANGGTGNIMVSNCKLGVGHGLSIGSSTTGGVHDMTVENVTFDGTTSGIRMKSSRGRGGLVENIAFKDLTMKKVGFPVFLSSYYPSPPAKPGDDAAEAVTATTPRFEHISIENLTVTGSPNSIVIWGLPEQPMSDIALTNVKITADKGALIYHVKGVRFSNVQLNVRDGAQLTTFDAEVQGMQGAALDGVGGQQR
jgi:polygalacturonase